MSGFLSGLGLVVIIGLVVFCLIIFSSFSISKDAKGNKDISLFWGAIKVNERERKVNIFGDFVSVDGKSKSVKVADIVDVDGHSEIVNVDNGKIIIDGKDNLIKVHKDLVVEVNDDHIIIKNDFNSKLLSLVTSLKQADDERLKLEGRKVGEDDIYILLEAKDGKKININVEVDI
ncbi:hypothetical protein [Halobacteriovorax sp.]|uniref:hypothetical protein n=1 Tax=Halobacteriovorax sp. TaxID=2020862 RepID=UPI0035637EC2